MATGSTPAKVRLSDQLGPADEAQPLVARLRARLAGSICNADGTYTVGNCPPDALSQEAADEIERLRATLAAIAKHSTSTLRTNSKDRGDWAEDVAFMGKLARGH